MAESRRRDVLTTLHRNLKRYPIEIRSSERVFFCGASGSGKTTMALQLVTPYAEWTVIDPKQDIALPQIPIRSTYYARIPRQILRASLDTKNERGEYDAMCENIFNARRGGIVYNDEITATTNASRLSPGLGKLVRMGRGIGIGMWSASQRPRDVPTALLTEALHFFIFRLSNPDDIKRIAAFTDPRVIAHMPRIDYECLYYSVKGNKLLRIPAS